MPRYCQCSPKLRLNFVPAQKQSPLGGLPALEAPAQQFDLWNRVRRLPGLAPRLRTSHGYSPELIVAQILYCCSSGGASLANAERLNDEPLVRQLARVAKFADQTQLGEWLRAQSEDSLAAVLTDFLGQLVRGQRVVLQLARRNRARTSDLVCWLIQWCIPRATPTLGATTPFDPATLQTPAT
ncbi:MAG TPA: hypothetical protein VI136_10385 [Verrucomicrobiae bacterium]